MVEAYRDRRCDYQAHHRFRHHSAGHRLRNGNDVYPNADATRPFNAGGPSLYLNGHHAGFCQYAGANCYLYSAPDAYAGSNCCPYAAADAYAAAHPYSIPHGHARAGVHQHAQTYEYSAPDQHAAPHADAQSFRQMGAG